MPGRIAFSTVYPSRQLPEGCFCPQSKIRLVLWQAFEQIAQHWIMFLSKNFKKRFIVNEAPDTGFIDCFLECHIAIQRFICRFDIDGINLKAAIDFLCFGPAQME